MPSFSFVISTVDGLAQNYHCAWRGIFTISTHATAYPMSYTGLSNRLFRATFEFSLADPCPHKKGDQSPSKKIRPLPTLPEQNNI